MLTVDILLPPVEACPEALDLVERYLATLEPERLFSPCSEGRTAAFEAYWVHTLGCRRCERFTFDRAAALINAGGR